MPQGILVNEMAENNTFMYGLVGGLLLIGLMLLMFNATFALPFGTAYETSNYPKFVVYVGGSPVAIPASDGQRVVVLDHVAVLQQVVLADGHFGLDIHSADEILAEVCV